MPVSSRGQEEAGVGTGRDGLGRGWNRVWTGVGVGVGWGRGWGLGGRAGFRELLLRVHSSCP